MDDLLYILVFFGLVFCGGLFLVLTFPFFEWPVPDFVKNCSLVRRLFAWDTIDDHQASELDREDLRRYLLAQQEAK